MKPITEHTIQQLIAAAAYANCCIRLEVVPTGVVMKLTKATSLASHSSIGRQTDIHLYVDRNEPSLEMEERIQKAFYALP